MSDLEQLNQLYNDWDVALDAAATAQRDIVTIMRQHLHNQESPPPLSMQSAANALWETASNKRAALESYFMSRCK